MITSNAGGGVCKIGQRLLKYKEVKELAEMQSTPTFIEVVVTSPNNLRNIYPRLSATIVVVGW